MQRPQGSSNQGMFSLSPHLVTQVSSNITLNPKVVLIGLSSGITDKYSNNTLNPEVVLIELSSGNTGK